MDTIDMILLMRAGGPEPLDIPIYLRDSEWQCEIPLTDDLVKGIISDRLQALRGPYGGPAPVVSLEQKAQWLAETLGLEVLYARPMDPPEPPRPGAIYD